MSLPPDQRAALLIVDLQEDFCPPAGTLAVASGRSIAPTINRLLTLPFALTVCTQDWHPASHISFAANHPPPNNTPYTSTIRIASPHDAADVQTTPLWPTHCIADTPGAALIPELERARVAHVVRKGTDERVEMFSAFRDSYARPVARSELAGLLERERVTHVYVVGLAADYCVKWTALHAAQDGYVTCVLEEATKAVDQTEMAMDSLKAELHAKGVEWKSVKSLGL